MFKDGVQNKLNPVETADVYCSRTSVLSVRQGTLLFMWTGNVLNSSFAASAARVFTSAAVVRLNLKTDANSHALLLAV
jgi:hypothetical protein